MEQVAFNYGSDQRAFMESVQRTLVEQPDFQFIGGHGPEEHGGHGLHRQTVIGIGDTTVKFRERVESES